MDIMLDPTRWWECPSCHGQSITHEARPHTPLHPCPSFNGLSAPYVQVTSNAGLGRGVVRHSVVEREDYVGAEVGVVHSGGRAVASIRTERADGSNDCHVFAPTARLSWEGLL